LVVALPASVICLAQWLPERGHYLPPIIDRLALRMPRGRPRGLPELPSAKRARGEEGSGPSRWDSWIPTSESGGEQDGSGGSATVSGIGDVPVA